MAGTVLSLVLPVQGAATQAETTLTSLSPQYQSFSDGVAELLVIEAPSDDMLGDARARANREHVRYLRVEAGPGARARSIALGLAESRAPFVGVFTDAAHLVTPRTLDTARRALALDDHPLVILPDYRFDETKVGGAGTIEGEQRFLEQRDWRKNPYDLFSAARFGPSTPNGALSPLLGAACLFAPKPSFDAIGAIDPRLDMPGGAALKLWMYTELARLPKTCLIVLAGEGAFRQHHPELDIASVRNDESSVQNLLFSAVAALPGFEAVHREPLAFGTVPGPALPFLAESAALAEYHCAACRARGAASWYVDPTDVSAR